MFVKIGALVQEALIAMSKNKEKMINGLKKLKRDEPTPEKSQPSGKNSREKTSLL